MRKLIVKLGFILLVISIIGLSGKVQAASSASASISTTASEIGEGKEVAVIVSIKDIDVGEGVNVLKANLEYDSNVLEYVKVESQNGWQPTFNSDKGILVNMYMSGLISKNQEIAKFVFKVKNGAKAGNSVIKLTNIEMANDNEKVSSDDASLTIKVQSDNSSNSENSNNASSNSSSTNKNQVNVAKNTISNNADNSMPHTGLEDGILYVIFGIVGVSAVISYYAYRKYRGV